MELAILKVSILGYDSSLLELGETVAKRPHGG